MDANKWLACLNTSGVYDPRRGYGYGLDRDDADALIAIVRDLDELARRENLNAFGDIDDIFAKHIPPD